MLGNFACFKSSAYFFKNQLLKKIFQEYHQCQTVWIQIRPNFLPVLIWVTIVCKGYQQMTKADNMYRKPRLCLCSLPNKKLNLVTQRVLWTGKTKFTLFHNVSPGHFPFMKFIMTGCIHLFSMH